MPDTLQVATWNVNSIRARLPRLLAWLERRKPDIVCLQETKVTDEEFCHADLGPLGYHCLAFGEKTYNGVAILSREEPTEVRRGLPDDEEGAQRRFLAATFGPLRVIDVYVPNGGEVGLPAYEFKLAWMARLAAHLRQAYDPTTQLLLCGDFNVAPADPDVWDPALWRDRILFSEPEKQAFRTVLDWGFVDSLREQHPDEKVFTFWDYRAGAFHRGWGLRIDHILLSRPLAARCLSVEVDREERKGAKPSDHAPVVATFARP